MEREKKLNALVNSFGDWWKQGFETPEMTQNLHPYTEMFKPITVNRLTLKNRLVMGPMGNISMCDETGRPNAKMLKYFEERAKGGVGLITSGLVPVTYGIDNSLIELGDLTYFPRIDRSRSVYAGWRDLVNMCHSHGSHFFIQLTAGLGRVGNPQCLTTQKKFPISSSTNPNWYMKAVPCLRLTDRSCKKIIKRVGQASADSKACNIDGVYLHGHEGYLLEQMTNTAFNRRTLGRYSDWMRFGIDMVEEIRRRCGADYPIMYRIDLSLALNATYGERMTSQSPLYKFKNERKVEETLEYMAELVKAGVDMFDVDLGSYDNWWLPHPPASMPAGCYLDVAKAAKEYFSKNAIRSNAGLSVPIVAVGKLGYPDLAEKALRDEKCDMVMLARPLLADPDWCNKAYAGKVDEIIPCIGCQEGCINEFVEGGHPQCAVNPRTAFEEEFSKEIPKAKKQKKVAVVGAGPAGIIASKTLLERGHKVVLFEKEKSVGGDLKAGSVPKIKFDIRNYLHFLERTVEKMKGNENFTLNLGKAATIEELKKDKYDAIITANGAMQSRPPESAIPGINNANVLLAVDVLANPDLVKDGTKMVVIGGGEVGAETAYMLNYEYGKDCKVVEMQKFIMNHVCTANRGHIIHYLEKGGVELLNCTKLLKIEDKKVYLSTNIHHSRPDPYNTWSPVLPENVINPLDILKPYREKNVEKVLDADYVILALGAKSGNALYYDLVKENAAAEIYNVGDSFKSANVWGAVRSAYRKARNI